MPDGWEMKRLDEIASVERGKFSARPRNDPKYYGGSIPFVQTGDVTSAGGLLTEYSQTLNERGLAVSRLFPKGTILVTIAANIGDVALTTFDVACPDSLVAVQAKGCSTEWLAYALQTKKQELERAATQNAQRNINLQVLRPLRVACPSLAEQRKIAEILSTWDEAIALTEQLIEAKRQLRSGLMQQLLRGKRRFGEFEGQPWSRRRLGELFVRLRRKAPPGVANVLSITAGVGFEQQKSKFSRVIAGKTLASYVLVKKGEFSYNKGNPKTYPQGCIYGLDEYEEGAVPKVYYSFRVNSSAVDTTFFSFVFELGALNEQLSRVINTGVRNDGLLNVSADDFFACWVDAPPLAEQRRIAEVLTAATQEVHLLERKLELLREQKRGLMQRLLTGELRVALGEWAA